MQLQQILMRIFASYENERTISAAFHILQGKRSGTTIQDVGLYRLFDYFGILKKLPRHDFDEAVKRMQHDQMLQVYENGQFTIMENGKRLLQQPFSLYFDGWHYRGNEHIFFDRLSLVIQTLSYQAAGIKAFAPITRDENVQQFCRKFFMFHQFPKVKLQQQLREELLINLQAADLSETQLEILTKRLHGANVFGFTWSQIAEQYQLDVLSCQLLYISALHKFISQIEHTGELLKPLTHGIKVTNVLTESAQLTADLYMKGRSLEEVANIRRLKLSTIEDHLVEFAMYEPSFSIEQFIAADDCHAVIRAAEQMMTKRLKVLKDAVPHLSYFQIKLALTKGGVR